MKTVGILTTFYNFDSSYSLCSVVESQLISLVKNGYKAVLFVHDNFKDDEKIPKGVEIRKVVPRFLLVDYSDHKEPSADLEEQAKTVYKMLDEHAKDIDVMFEHDLIFQGWFLPYCMAIHQYAEGNPMKWFHWIHSVPTVKNDVPYPHCLRYILPKNSKIVYLNNYHLMRAAEAYHVMPKDVRIVHNPVDPRMFWRLHPLVLSMIERFDLLNADIIQTYPVSTTRMVDGKGLYALIEIFAALKKGGSKVRLIICNAHANDKREKQVISQAVSFASSQGLNQSELIFTSLEEEPKYELGVPREVVSDLFRLSNVFVFPSVSENCSLVLLEAMLSGNLLILNDSVRSMREFGAENALYFRFGGVDEDGDMLYSKGKEAFHGDIAKIIISELTNNKSIRASRRARQSFNYDVIFKQQIEPLLSEI